MALTPPAFISGFSNDQANQQALLTPQSIERRRQMADAMMTQGMNYAPVQSWTQGMARVADAIMGGLASRRADAAETAGRQQSANSMLSSLSGMFGGSAGPGIAGASPPGGLAGAAPTGSAAITVPQGAADAAPATGGLDIARADQAIKNIESSGGNYGAVGPVTTYKNGTQDRPYGAHQVMGANIPDWTQKYYGQSLTPEQYLGNKAAQDAVFQGEFGRLAGKYGPEGAAQAWLGGEGSVGKLGRADLNGTTVGAYGQQFSKYYNGGTSQQASAPDPRAAGMVAGLDPSIGAPAPNPVSGAPAIPPIVPPLGATPQSGLTPDQMKAFPVPGNPGKLANPELPADDPANQVWQPGGLTMDPSQVAAAVPQAPASPTGPGASLSPQDQAILTARLNGGGAPPVPPQVGPAPVPPAGAMPPGAAVAPPGLGPMANGPVPAAPPMPPQDPRTTGAIVPAPSAAAPLSPQAQMLAALQNNPPKDSAVQMMIARGINPANPGAPPVSPGASRIAQALGLGGGAPQAPQTVPAVAGGATGSVLPPGSPQARVADAMAPQAGPAAAAPAGQAGPPQQAMVALAQVMNDPWASPETKNMAMQTFQMRYGQHKLIPIDTGTGTQMYDEITMQPRGALIPKYRAPEKMAPGEYLANPLTGAPVAGGEPPAASHALVTPEDRAKWGIPTNDDKPYFVDAAGKLQTPDRGTTVNMQAQTDFAKGVDKANLEHYDPYIQAGHDARTKMQALNMIQDILTRSGGNITTGPGAAMMLKAKQALVNAGLLDASEATPTEMLQKLSTQLATADAKSLTGRPTQFDFSTYLQNNPGIQMSIAGQKALVDIKMQQAKHDQDLSTMAYQFLNSPDAQKNPAKFDEMIRQYDQANPIINRVTGKPYDPTATDFPDPNAPQGQNAAPQGGTPAAPVAAPVPVAPAPVPAAPIGGKSPFPQYPNARQNSLKQWFTQDPSWKEGDPQTKRWLEIRP